MEIKSGPVLGFGDKPVVTERFYTCPDELDVYYVKVFSEPVRHGQYKVAENTDHCFEGEFLYKDNIFHSYIDACERVELMIQEKIEEAQYSLDHYKQLLTRRNEEWS